MAKVLVALLRFSPRQQKELLQKVDEQVNQVGDCSPILLLHCGRLSSGVIAVWGQFELVNHCPH